MIDIKQLREDPDRYRRGAAAKRMGVDIDRLLSLDERRRALITERERLKSEQNALAKASGKAIGQLMGRLKKAEGDQKAALEAELAELKAGPATLKASVQALESQIAEIEPELDAILLTIPQPPDVDVPAGASSDDNVEIRRWDPEGYDTARSFADNRNFAPRSHVELGESLALFDVARAVKMAGTRSYALTGDGFRLHNAVLRYAFDFMVDRHGFTPMSVPVLVREEAMVGTAFFPHGRDQAYLIEETSRGSGQDLFLTGTGEVGLMGLHADEILDEADLPLCYTTVSTCFRREAGAAGKDTAGLYRIHQFDKVEQVVICRADEDESRAWHAKMIGFVEEFLQSLGLPYRLIQCCAGDLGPKNADQVDIECWMPSRGDDGPDGSPTGAYGETHSASRLYDYQCRRLNMRCRPGGEGGRGPTTFCHSLNNTVAASPRILIPILEMHQSEDGTVTVPEALRPYMGGRERIERSPA
jgi:seryl-tRNA synthetase